MIRWAFRGSGSGAEDARGDVRWRGMAGGGGWDERCFMIPTLSTSTPKSGKACGTNDPGREYWSGLVDMSVTRERISGF